jgi:hypothetical protein
VLSGQTTYHVGNTGLGLFALGRGALLAGKTNGYTNFTQTINDPTGITGIPGTPNSSQVRSSTPTSTDSVLPVLEIEVGLEYALRLGGNSLFARAAVVSQTYFGAGNASRSDANLSLFGCQLSAGLNY